MAEVAGLVPGVIGVVGLFKSCIDNFDIVVRARHFSEDFDLLCIQLALQRIRLVLWGESLGLVPSPLGDNVPYNRGLDRPGIKEVVEASLNQLRLLLEKASMVTDQFEPRNTNDSSPLASTTRLLSVSESSPGSMSLFRDRFEAFRSRIHANQKKKSIWQVTRWAVHDAAAFKATVDRIKELLDSLESITGTLENLLQRQRAALIEEIESVSDTRSLRLIQMASGSLNDAETSTRLISDTASHRLSLVESSAKSSHSRIADSGSSYNTAPSYPRAQFPKASDRPIFATSQPNNGNIPDSSEGPQQSLCRAVTGSLRPHEPEVADQQAPQTIDCDSLANIPQNQRLMANLNGRIKGSSHKPPLNFESGQGNYGNAMFDVRLENERRWESVSTGLICKADTGILLARRVFLELRSIRLANVPFISATPLDDRLDTILACIEGPPDTPYEGGKFWISIRIPEENPAAPPVLKFQTRIFHPNIDCTGRICADYQPWWMDPSLTRYLSSVSRSGGYSWFSEHSAARYSLGALLTAICALLSSPNVDDPLVPEIAELYVRDYARYEEVARDYTYKYAREPRRPHFEDLDLYDPPSDQQSVTIVPHKPDNTDASSSFRDKPLDSDTVSTLSHTSRATFRTVKLETIDGGPPVTYDDLSFEEATRPERVVVTTYKSLKQSGYDDLAKVLVLYIEKRKK